MIDQIDGFDSEPSGDGQRQLSIMDSSRMSSWNHFSISFDILSELGWDEVEGRADLIAQPEATALGDKPHKENIFFKIFQAF